MHRVVKAHLDGFVAKFGVEGDDARRFESFVNYAIFRSFCAETVDPKDLVYVGPDPGIDGIMIFIDDVYVSSAEEVEDVFKQRKKDSDALIVFTQAKTSERWSKEEINNFESAVVDFLSEEPSYPHSEYIAGCREVFDAILKNVGRLRSGKPSAYCFFVTTAKASSDKEILAAQKALRKSVNATGLFNDVKMDLLNRDSIVELWKSADGQIEAALKVVGMAAFPNAPGIEEGYVVTVKAKDFVEQVLTDSNGRLRQRIFDENVRDFIGLDGEINVEMSKTLSSPAKQKRFGILNNGITLISPDVRVAGLEIYIRDFQIVNGCQTSNILFEHREKITSDATLMLKVVETADAEVVDDIVRSTNRQAKVDDDQFLATLDSVKALERYFEARGNNEEYGLFFERCKNQFASIESAKLIRIFDIKELARCVAAMFLDKADIAGRYPNRLTGDLRDSVFNKKYNEEVYYIAAYTLYRLKLLLGNKRIDPKYGKLRWHIIMAIKYLVCGPKLPQLDSNKIKQTCADIEQFMSRNDDEMVKTLKDLCAAIVDIDDVTRDKLKGSSLVQDVRDKALAQRLPAYR